jgi:hypothetical protein
MLLAWIGALFAAESPATRPPLDFSKFDLGVCPGCRGLRAVHSPQCATCHSTAPVAADA